MSARREAPGWLNTYRSKRPAPFDAMIATVRDLVLVTLGGVIGAVVTYEYPRLREWIKRKRGRPPRIYSLTDDDSQPK